MQTKRILRGSGLALCALLIGCGAEREEPFNPSEPEEVRDPLSVSLVYEDQTNDEFSDLPVTDVASRRIEIIRDQEDFETLIDAYTFVDVTVNIPDFEEGQVLLYDSGWFDDSACAQQLTLNRSQAFSITENESVAEVVLTYNRREADDEATCNNEVVLRQWEFLYIETRAHLVVSEQVRGVNDGSGASSSSSSSSNDANNSDFDNSGFNSSQGF